MTDVTFSPDGQHILTYTTLDARIWNLRSGRLAVPPLFHGTFIDHAAYSPDGNLLVTVSTDFDSLRLWDAVTGEPLVPLQRSESPSLAVVSPGGHFLATIAEDSNTAEIRQLPHDERPLTDLALVADMMSAIRLTASGGIEPLNASELDRIWNTLYVKYP